MFMQFFIVTTIILVMAVRWKNRHKRRLFREMRNNLKSWPLIGHIPYFLGSNEDRMKSFCEIGKESIRCGGSTCIWLMNDLIVVMADPADTEVVLKTCLEKHESRNVFNDLLGNCTFIAPVSTWRPRRKILFSQFNSKRILSFMSVYSKNSKILVNRLKSTVDNGIFSLWDYIAAYSMDSTGENILGTELGAQKQNNNPFSKALVKFGELLSDRVFQPWLQNGVIYKLTPSSSVFMKLCVFMNDFVKQLIVEKRSMLNELRKDPVEKSFDNFDAKEDRPKSMLDAFIEAAEFTDTEMHEETLGLSMGGTESTSVSVCFTILLLSRHQDVQEKLHKEIQDYYEDSSNPVSCEDLTHLKYLDAVIKEALRLYPPFPLITRVVDQHLTLPSGKTLIPGVGVFINIWAIHRNPHYWGIDAEDFRPERFLERELKHPAAYMPFSRGVRNCIGLQYGILSMKTVLINLIRTYKFFPPADDDSKSLNVKYNITLKHTGDFKVRLETRQK